MDGTRKGGLIQKIVRGSYGERPGTFHREEKRESKTAPHLSMYHGALVQYSRREIEFHGMNMGVCVPCGRADSASACRIETVVKHDGQWLARRIPQQRFDIPTDGFGRMIAVDQHKSERRVRILQFIDQARQYIARCVRMENHIMEMRGKPVLHSGVGID